MRPAKRQTLAAFIAAALAVAVTGGPTVHAHKAVTSPYTYNEHVLPILRDHCGRCHVEGGVAPMSLLAYKDASGGAFAWAQSLREMVAAEAMPPWYVDPTGPAVLHAHTLSARELDVIVTWASGGAPEGESASTPAPETPRPKWLLGKPDVVLPLPAHEVDANTTQESVDAVISTGESAARWVKAADLLPGAPSMVRRARISIVDGPTIALWEPGDDATTAPHGTAFKLAPGTKLRVEIFYKKPWQEEREAKRDVSSVGLYFVNSPEPPSTITAVTIGASKLHDQTQLPLRGAVGAAARVLAVRPQLDTVYSTMEITAVTPSGQRLPLLKLHAARPEWPRRYWLQQPVNVPAGSTIEVTGTRSDSDPGQAAKSISWPLEIGLDVTR
jgi:hypothetical protein